MVDEKMFYFHYYDIHHFIIYCSRRLLKSKDAVTEV